MASITNNPANQPINIDREATRPAKTEIAQQIDLSTTSFSGGIGELKFNAQETVTDSDALYAGFGDSLKKKVLKGAEKAVGKKANDEIKDAVDGKDDKKDPKSTNANNLLSMDDAKTMIGECSQRISILEKSDPTKAQELSSKRDELDDIRREAKDSGKNLSPEDQRRFGKLLTELRELTPDLKPDKVYLDKDEHILMIKGLRAELNDLAEKQVDLKDLRSRLREVSDIVAPEDGPSRKLTPEEEGKLLKLSQDIHAAKVEAASRSSGSDNSGPMLG